MLFLGVFHLTIAGPDGTGKSLLAEGLVRTLENEGYEVTRKHFIGSKVKSTINSMETNPHELNKRRLATQYLSILFRFVRAKGFYFRLGALNKNNKPIVIIEERGWLDQLADPTRYRLGANSNWLIKFLSSFLPKPHQYLLLLGDAEIINCRKPELTPPEIRRQISRWKEILSGAESAEIDTTVLSLQDSLSEALFSIREQILTLETQNVRSWFLLPSRLEEWHIGNNRREIKSLYRPQSLIRRSISRAYWFQISKKRHLSVTELDILRLVHSLSSRYTSLTCIRSVGRNQWVLFLSCNFQLAEVIKVKTSANIGFEREYQILSKLDGKVGKLKVPKVISYSATKEFEVLRLSLAGDFSGPSARPEVALEAAIELKRAFNGIGVTHGDLTPWNLTERPVPGLVDWESARIGLDEGYDLQHFLHASKHRLSPTEIELMMEIYRSS